MKMYFKNNRTALVFLLAMLAVAPIKAQVAFGDAAKFNDGWLFRLTDDSAIVRTDYDDSEWRKLSLPHDWSIEGQLSPTLASCTGYLPGGIGWYRKHFRVEDNATRHYIYFEGVYNRSEVYLNGHLLGRRPNGYVSFLYDMTPYLKEGDNVLAVRVDHSRYADSRWYTGSGIYRDVWLVAAPDTHIAQWGVGWHAASLTDKQAVVAVDVEVEKHKATSDKLELKASLYDTAGKKVAQRRVRVADGKEGIAKQSLDLKVSKPHRWNLDNPYLYTLKTELLANGKRIDGSETKVGLRTLEFDANKGFALNGNWMKVKGVCLHHDAGVLGAVVPPEVWERRLNNLKGIGVNAIRMSHNPQAPVLYELCDRLGFLVMDEVSDEWEFPKRKWVQGWNVGTPSYDGTFDFFEEWIERDVTDMVRRDRNHTCIFLWSIGNEVDYPNDPYSHPVLDGAKINQPMFGGYKPDAPDAMRIGTIAKRLAACVRAVDTSRPVTGALAGVVMSNETEYPDAVDVVGYNYTENRYDQAMPLIRTALSMEARRVRGLMPGMPSATRISSSGSSSGPVRIIWVNRADGRPAVCTRVCSISEVSPSHADISGLRCGARIRSRMQEHIRYMSIPSIPSMYSFRLMHGTSGTMTRGRTYVWCVIPMLRRRVCCSTAEW